MSEASWPLAADASLEEQQEPSEAGGLHVAGIQACGHGKASIQLWKRTAGSQGADRQRQHLMAN